VHHNPAARIQDGGAQLAAAYRLMHSALADADQLRNFPCG
jgi:hypothetical protein